jgi:UDP-N-acetylglucosamine--N-acetylmuramyl-(pentapeptide) pyrophosphoryl-undecaprenol N-acetylglucosamine transferase
MGVAPLQVVIAGGGTGGHLFPGIAIAREILRREPNARVTFAGTSRGIEARVVPNEGFELDVIRSKGLKGKSLVDRLNGLLTLPLSALDAWRVVSARAPHVVVGVGGYSSGPVVATAWARGIPTLLHEQNARPGFTNRRLGRVADAVAVTFATTVREFGPKAFVSGNPVRPTFLQPSDEPHGARKVLIFGGSQGAHAINMAVVEGASDLARAIPPLAITHQTGERDLVMVREGLARAGLAARVEPFIADMAQAMKHANVVVSRAGSTTLAEIAAVGRASLLIPLPTATDDHQRRNAEALASAGAAEVLDQRALSGATLAARIIALVNDDEKRRRMAAASKAFARPDAARVIVDRVLALARDRHSTPA